MTSHVLHGDGAALERSTVTRLRRNAVVCTIVGNSLEWFDFASYAYLATVISSQFFSSADRATALIAAFAVFGIGFISRPLGAVVIGRIGDVKGRKFALMVTMPMMGLGTLVIGLLPTYWQIGVTAPLLLVCCRLIQGFSAGGDSGNVTTYLMEWAPSNRRGVYSSLSNITAVGGTVVGSGLAAALSTLLSPDALQSWGWRVPFLIGGLIIAPLSYYLRTKVDETPDFLIEQRNEGTTKADEGDRASVWIGGLQTLGISGCWFVTHYVFLVYAPAFIILHGRIHGAAPLWFATGGLFMLMVGAFIAARLSDSLGRKPLILAGAIGFMVFAYPSFVIFRNSDSYWLVGLTLFTDGSLVGIFAGVCTAAMAELFPTRLRTTGVSIGYGLSVAIFGGFASVIAEYLIRLTGYELAPSFYVIGAAVLSFLTTLTLKETAHLPLKR
ncbi:MFS transporter [Caballeronia sp. LZ035]|uniref:MFS transporter n=1 Tax=Caballeronia sp. LZ035 TaxID=3038568 RepID=UPI0028615BC3|nr:MFS transporter [Caballeronia sp. LZ035]MDR5760555.1 MFS transporter [Caballeronia sp. LZ035]